MRAAIFDMDGLLIDSEPLWRKAEIESFREVGLELSEDDCRETMGYRLNEVVDLWHARQPWSTPDKKTVERNILNGVARYIHAEGKPLPGVRKALDTCRAASLKIGLASSSPPELIRAVVERLGLADDFDVIRSAANEEFGKPHPAVFIQTARALDVSPEECVVFEDSVHGMIAALAAKMRVICIPEPGLRNHPAFGAAHLVLNGLEELEATHLDSQR